MRVSNLKSNSAAQVNQLEEAGDEVDDMEEVPMEDGHGNVTVARRRKIKFGHIKWVPPRNLSFRSQMFGTMWQCSGFRACEILPEPTSMHHMSNRTARRKVALGYIKSRCTTRAGIPASSASFS